jgi:hypothetical protein
MDPATFIVGLMKENTDALGFIPKSAIANYFVPRNEFIIVRDRRFKPIGYLLHGPVHPDGTLYVHQVCIQYDKRLRYFGAQAIRELLARAHAGQAHRITLRCALDLDATAFWHAMGFHAIAIERGGRRRNRLIQRFVMDLTPCGRPTSSPAGLRASS